MPSIVISIGETNGTEIQGKRKLKGRSLLEAAENYVVLDLETTGLDPSWDEIIEIAAIKVENGATVDQYQTLVKPSYPIDAFITEMTGITNEMLSTAPSINEVLPAFSVFLGDWTIVAHNANFDVNFLYDAFSSHEPLMVLSNNFVDTMRLSRRLFQEHRHHRLCDLIERFGICAEIEHRALSDASKAKDCYEYMKAYAEQNSIEFSSLYPVRQGLKASDVTSSTTDFDVASPVYGKVFVFTGTLEKLVRKDAMQLVVDMGGLCGDGVTKDTNYLVLGNNDYCSSIKDGKSSKQKKAEKYKAAGMDIEIISENVFYDLLSESTHEGDVFRPGIVKQEEQPPEARLDDFELQCVRTVQSILPTHELRYSCTSNRLNIHSCAWGFISISKMKKGYFVQPEWNFDLSKYEDVLTCDSTKSCKRIFLDKPEDIYKIADYVLAKQQEMQQTWNDYTESVSPSTANKRRKEYESSSYPIPAIKD